MAIIQISKIQQRSGNLVDLPQLDEAQFGWASDAKRLFIGKTTPNENIEVLTSYSNISFSQIDGSDGGNFNISSATNGQVLTYVSTTNTWENWPSASILGADPDFKLNLGDVGNIKMEGGATGYILETDGAGNVAWTSKGTLRTPIIGLSNATPIIMTVANTTPYTNGLAVTISGATAANANTIVNGQTFYVKVANNFPTTGNVELYTTPDLNSANGVVGTNLGTYTANSGIATALLSGSGTSNAGGSVNTIQFNNSGILNGSANFTITGGNLVTLQGNFSASNINGGNLVNANFVTGTLTTAAQPNITSVGTLTSLSASGNITGGNITTSGRLVSSIATGTAPLTITSTTRVSNLSVAYANVSDFGVVTAQNTGTYYPTFVSSSTTGNKALAANSTFSANLANGAFIATTFVGSLSGAATSATTADTVTTAAQPNITSTGTLASLSVSGNANIGNIGTAGIIVSSIATGTAPFTVTSTTRVSNLSVAYANVADFMNVTTQTSGNGYLIFANALTGNVAETANAVFVANTSNGALYATTFVGSLSGAATTAATVTTAAQPNITSTGTLVNLAVSGNATFSGANVSLGSVSNLKITGGTADYVLKTDGAGNLSWVAQSGANGVSSISNGNSNVIVTANGNVTTSVAGNANIVVVTGTGANVTGTLRVTGNLTAANLILSNASVITTGANTNVGTITGNWSLSAGSRLNATYADLAEYYEADMEYGPGTVLEFGGEKEVTIAEDGTARVAGVVSTNPAYAMNANCQGIAVAIALQGRVPTKVRGMIRKGDMMVSGGNGFARPSNAPQMGTVIGKALENFDGIEGVIEIAVGRL